MDTSQQTSEPGRRTALKAGAGLIAGVLAARLASAQSAPTQAAPANTESPNPKAPMPTDTPPAPPPPGKPGDFDFLAGEWRIKHRRLKTPRGNDWEDFEGEATCWNILGGVGSVEELRIPARNFAGMGLRLLDVQKQLWSDFWVNAKSGVLTTPGQTGHFSDGVGTFTADDTDNEGKPIKVKGVWDNITGKSCRWWQAASWDGGATWEKNWVMEWTKV
ncbi:MAG: DUF1579 domain-containing protein [Phycisphaerales bacterium]